MAFLGGLKRLMVDIKIYRKLHFVYPTKDKLKKIKSILPNHITTIGNDVVVEERVDFGSTLTCLEDGLYIGRNTYIGNCKQIGKYSSISYDVKIGLISHPLTFISTSPIFYAKRRGWVNTQTYNESENGPTIIGADVLISANAIILAGVKIGNGAVIAAGAFVNKDVAPYSIVGGVPAKLIKYRFSEEEIKNLEASKWWEKSKDELLKLKDYFNSPKEFLKNLQLKK